MNSNIPSLKRKRTIKDEIAKKRPKPSLEPPQMCTPNTVIKQKRLRRKSKPKASPLLLTMTPKASHLVQTPQTAPQNKLKFSASKENTPSRLKQPTVVNSKSAKNLFFARSFHTTGYTHQDTENQEVEVNESSSLNNSFSSYNTSVLNYRLFTTPIREKVFKFK